MPGSIIGGIFANKAAKTQAKAAEEAGDVQMEMFDKSVALSEPWRTAGEGALDAYMYELGFGENTATFGATTSYGVGDQSFSTRAEAEQYRQGLIGGGSSGGTDPTQPVWVAQRGGQGDVGGGYWAPPQQGAGTTRVDQVRGVFGLPPEGWAGGTGGNALAGASDIPGIVETSTGGSPYKGFQKTPGYDFQMDEGQRSINRSLAARGRLLSGPAVKEGMRFGQGLADQTYSAHLARLAGVSGFGGGVAQGQGANALATGQGVGNALIQGGNARASGYAATGQAISGSINAIGNIFGGISGGLGG